MHRTLKWHRGNVDGDEPGKTNHLKDTEFVEMGVELWVLLLDHVLKHSLAQVLVANIQP